MNPLLKLAVHITVLSFFISVGTFIIPLMAIPSPHLWWPFDPMVIKTRVNNNTSTSETQHIRFGLTSLPFARNVVYAGNVSRNHLKQGGI